ncbi:MAG: aldo/keto reductase [Dorea sp.]
MSAKKLGFGLMRLPLLDENDKGSIDIEYVKRMVDTFIERGFTYFDTAWMYCKFKSENAAKEALVERYPRDKFTLASKLHSAFFKSFEERDEIFEEQRKKTGVEYFDYYLLHDINEESYELYEKFDCFNWIQEKKAQGLVKCAGFSSHAKADFLDKILTEHPELEFVQLQINYLDWESEEVQSRKCYEVAKKHGKPVIVMEPVKGGKLAQVPEEVEALFKGYDDKMSMPSWAVRFVAGLDNVFMVLSGMSDMDQMLDNTDYMMDFKPLSEEELKLVSQAADIIKTYNKIPCTGCAYCLDGCPVSIAIPEYFNVYNADVRGESGQGEKYKKLAENGGKASECAACGQCEAICPQRLPIITELQTIVKHFEK